MDDTDDTRETTALRRQRKWRYKLCPKKVILAAAAKYGHKIVVLESARMLIESRSFDLLALLIRLSFPSSVQALACLDFESFCRLIHFNVYFTRYPNLLYKPEVKMSMSGIEVDNDTKKAFEEMKLKKTHELLVMQIEDNKRIKVNVELSKEKCTNEEFHEFIKDHPKNCFFLVHDFKPNANAMAKKLMLLSWVPDASNVKEKMIYASTKGGLKTKFDGIKTFVEGNDLDDVTLASLEEKSRKS